MPIHMQEIRTFLRRVEGPQQTQGYIPCDLVDGGTANYTGGFSPERYIPMGVSGVTIATGVDLGQTDAITLALMGVGDSTIALLTPYLNRSKKAAVAALHQCPLTIPCEMAEELDAAMHHHHAGLIEAR